LRAFYLAGFGIAAMAETFLIGLVHHAQDTSSRLQLTLRQQSELSHFGRSKQRGTRILAGGDTRPAADTGRCIKSRFG
jgi:hypothetical protein